jgi:hypothetical protein
MKEEGHFLQIIAPQTTFLDFFKPSFAHFLFFFSIFSSKKCGFKRQKHPYLSLLSPYLHLHISLSYNSLQRIGAEVQIFLQKNSRVRTRMRA